MAILFIPGSFNAEKWVTALQKVDTELDIRVWPVVGNPDDIQFALVWRYPSGELLKYKNLRFTRDMTQYVVLAVLNHVRRFGQYQQHQAKSQWIRYDPSPHINIGIMGMGKLGQDVALKLHDLGFPVVGWSKTTKTIDGINIFASVTNPDAVAPQLVENYRCALAGKPLLNQVDEKKGY